MRQTILNVPPFLYSLAVERIEPGETDWTGTLLGTGYIFGARFVGIEKYLGPVSTAIMAALLLNMSGG